MQHKVFSRMVAIRLLAVYVLAIRPSALRLGATAEEQGSRHLLASEHQITFRGREQNHHHRNPAQPQDKFKWDFHVWLNVSKESIQEP